MNESGINSFEEFLLCYLAAGFVIGALWVILETDVVLAPEHERGERRRRQLRLIPFLAALGALHVAFGVVAADISRPGEGEVVRHRARQIARAGLVAGIAVFAAVAAPHLPVLSDLPGVSAVERAVPWESR